MRKAVKLINFYGFMGEDLGMIKTSFDFNEEDIITYNENDFIVRKSTTYIDEKTETKIYHAFSSDKNLKKL